MNRVTVYFTGICVHVKQLRCRPPEDALANGLQSDLPGTWAIMPDCRHGRRLYNNETTSPHRAKLHIPRHFLNGDPTSVPGMTLVSDDGGEVATWELNSADLYIPHARGTLDDNRYAQLPSLTQQSDALSLELDRRVVVGGRAAARFGIFAGQVDVFRHHDAAGVAFTVETEYPPILKTKWTCDNEYTGQIELKGDRFCQPKLFVQNTGGKSDDQDADFHLNYDIVTRVPGVKVPTSDDLSTIRQATAQEAADLDLLGPFGGMGPGCSNSDFP